MPMDLINQMTNRHRLLFVSRIERRQIAGRLKSTGLALNLEKAVKNVFYLKKYVRIGPFGLFGLVISSY